MTCVCFANPSSLGVAAPFLTQKQPFPLSRSEPFLTRKTIAGKPGAGWGGALEME
jgi:hypothetical protein